MSSLLEQARGSLSFHDFGLGSSYSDSVRETIDEQRYGKVNPESVREPFERLFIPHDIVVDEASHTQVVAWTVPNQAFYEPTSIQVVMKLPTAMPMTYGPWDVLKLAVIDTVSGEEINMSVTNSVDDPHKTTCYPFNGLNKFSSNPPRGRMTVGYPDHFAALYNIGHERTHVDDPAFKDPLLAGALVKKVAIEMLNGKKLVHFMGNSPDEIKSTLRVTALDYTNIAGKSENWLLSEPLTMDECQALLDSEETAAKGGIEYLRELARFMRFTEAQQEALCESAGLYAIDALASYITFTREYVGKSFEDVCREMGK